MDDSALLASVELDLAMYGLGPDEARAMIAVLRRGSLSGHELADACGFDGPTAGATLDSLRAKGLIEASAGDTGRWTSRGREEVLRRLLTRWGDHVEVLALRMDQTRRALAQLVPEPLGAPPPLRLVAGAVQVERTYEEVLAGARTEVLAFNRPPYGFWTARANGAVIQLLTRGVDTRVLYRRADLCDPHAADFRRETAGYVRAGLQAAMVDDLPLKMVVVDRCVAMLTLLGAGDAGSVLEDGGVAGSNGGFPPSLVTDDPGLASALGATFEYYWQRADSCVNVLPTG